jgi:hypothetical protein
MSNRILTKGLKTGILSDGAVSFIIRRGLSSLLIVVPELSSRRQRIVDQIKALLMTVTVTNGFKTDIGSSVFEWKSTDFQITDMPGVDVRDPEEQVATRGTNHIYTLTIEIEAKVSASSSTNQSREVLADIQTLMGSNQNLGGLVYKVTPVDNELLDFEKVNNKLGSVLIRFEVEYATKAFQPYT